MLYNVGLYLMQKMCWFPIQLDILWDHMSLQLLELLIYIDSRSNNYHWVESWLCPHLVFNIIFRSSFFFRGFSICCTINWNTWDQVKGQQGQHGQNMCICPMAFLFAFLWTSIIRCGCGIYSAWRVNLGRISTTLAS